VVEKAMKKKKETMHKRAAFMAVALSLSQLLFGFIFAF